MNQFGLLCFQDNRLVRDTTPGLGPRSTAAGRCREEDCQSYLTVAGFMGMGLRRGLELGGHGFVWVKSYAVALRFLLITRAELTNGKVD